MSRLLGVALVAVAVVVCAQALSSTSARATGTCGPAGAPPIPRVDAVRDGGRIRVEYTVARPAGCMPDAVLITVRSAAKPENVAPSPTNGLIRLTGSEGTVQLEVGESGGVTVRVDENDGVKAKVIQGGAQVHPEP